MEEFMTGRFPGPVRSLLPDRGGSQPKIKQESVSPRDSVSQVNQARSRIPVPKRQARKPPKQDKVGGGPVDGRISTARGAPQAPAINQGIERRLDSPQALPKGGRAFPLEGHGHRLAEIENFCLSRNRKAVQETPRIRERKASMESLLGSKEPRTASTLPLWARVSLSDFTEPDEDMTAKPKLPSGPTRWAFHRATARRSVPSKRPPQYKDLLIINSNKLSDKDIIRDLSLKLEVAIDWYKTLEDRIKSICSEYNELHLENKRLRDDIKDFDEDFLSIRQKLYHAARQAQEMWGQLSELADSAEGLYNDLDKTQRPSPQLRGV
jgi:regulator of replication initiation timing